MKIKLDENLPVSAAAILQAAGHDVDTVIAEGLTDAPTPTSSQPRPQLAGSSFPLTAD